MPGPLSLAALWLGAQTGPKESGLWNAEISADFSCEEIVYFGVARDSAPAPIGWIAPPGVLRTFTDQCTSMGIQVRQQDAALHAARITRTSS